jgi:hypothetical protein
MKLMPGDALAPFFTIKPMVFPVKPMASAQGGMGLIVNAEVDKQSQYG